MVIIMQERLGCEEKKKLTHILINNFPRDVHAKSAGTWSASKIPKRNNIRCKSRGL